MPTSTNKKPQDRKPKSTQKKATSAKAWKKNAGAKPVELELPSGNVALIRQIPLTTLLSDGLLPDSLAAMVRKKTGDTAPASKEEVQAPSQDEIGELMSDPAKLKDMFKLFDAILVRAVVEPKVLSPEDAEGVAIPDEDRDEEALYADEVDLQDKVFIFQYTVGGSQDLERFRGEYGDALGGMEAVTGL